MRHRPFQRSLAVIFLLFVLLGAVSIPANAQSQSIRVYYAGPEGSVLTALKLAENITLTSSLADAQTIVLNGQIPDPQAVADQARRGAGLVLILGPNTGAEQLSTLLGETVTLTPRTDAISLSPFSSEQSGILKDVVWTSAPQVRERAEISGGGLTPIVVGYEDNELLLGERSLGQGSITLLTAYLDGTNPQFQDWAYFNYMIYNLAVRAAGASPLSFADYPASPLPHARAQIILFAVLAVMLATSVTAFILVRRYSRAHPQILDTLVADSQEFKKHEAGTGWEVIGFHRPLGGFLVIFMMGLVLFIPLIIYQNLVLPVYILPSAQALGIWGRVTQFFNVLWLFFDMGTSNAFIKYFSQYRVHDPRRAIQYGQVFVWWQALSGAVQVALVVILASTALPRSVYALYAWSVIIHTFIQIPGFYKLFRNGLSALQRFDYTQIIDLGVSLVFPMLTQPIFVIILIIWGRGQPAYGMAMGGLIGLGIAAYATEALQFLLGWLLYRRLGYNSRVFMLAHFDWSVIREAFRFGVFDMLGSMAWGVGQAVEILVTQTRLVNYAEIWGNWGVAQNFVFSFNVMSTLYDNLMPSISEAISHARQVLSQYYAAMAYKYGGMICAFIAAVLLAVSDRFILGATGPEFTRAALYVIPLIFWGALQYPSWVGDCVQRGTNKPQLVPAMVGMEQFIRIGLMWLLVDRLQINALILAYIIAISIKDVVAYFINHKVCFPQRFYFWQSLFAPLLAGGAHYLVVRWVTGLIWQGEQVTSIVIFFIGIFLSYPLFAFFYGFFGGWDDATLQELEQSSELTTFIRPLARLFYLASALGARANPLLHNRFPIEIRAQALEEAKVLTKERVSLVKD